MNPIRSHERGAEGSSLVYPVLSRRAGGLSLGINLFPGRKVCNFDCPYCEVPAWKTFPASRGERDGGAGSPAAPERLDADLESFLSREYQQSWAEWPLRDICLSGDGEPTLSPILFPALEICAKARTEHPAVASEAEIRIITNATGFLRPELAASLADFWRREGLSVWAKLDSGSQEGFTAMSRSGMDLESILSGILAYGRLAPLTVQTMICSLRGVKPGAAEADAYADRLDRLQKEGARIEAVHVYTVARNPLEPWAEALSKSDVQAFIDRVGGKVRGRFPLLGFDGEGMEAMEARW